MSREHHYQLALNWAGTDSTPTTSNDAYSREYVISVEGKPSFRGSADPLFRGDGTLYNPEEMLMAALAGCHMLSFLALASRAGMVVTGYTDDPEGTMNFEGGSGRFTGVTLRPRVIVTPGTDFGRVEELHHQAHAACFIANSVNFPVEVVGVVDSASGEPS